MKMQTGVIHPSFIVSSKTAKLYSGQSLRARMIRFYRRKIHVRRHLPGAGDGLVRAGSRAMRTLIRQTPRNPESSASRLIKQRKQARHDIVTGVYGAQIPQAVCLLYSAGIYAGLAQLMLYCTIEDVVNKNSLLLTGVPEDRVSKKYQMQWI